jgi:glycosyltransferase involved in cell wall biosynthesis
MKIALIADPGSPHTRAWVDALADRGHDVYIFSPYKQPAPAGLRAVAHAPLAPHADGTAAPGNQTDSAAMPRSAAAAGRPALGRIFRVSDRWRLGTISRSLRLCAVLQRWLEEIRPDRLIALRLQPEGYLARISGWRPYAVMSWGQDVLRVARGHPVHLSLSRRAVSDAALVIGETDAVVAGLHALGAPDRNILKGMTGIDIGYWRPPTEADAVLARETLRTRHAEWGPWLDAAAQGARVIFSPRAVATNGHQRELIKAMALWHETPLKVGGPPAAPSALLAALLLQTGIGDLTVRTNCDQRIAERQMSQVYCDLGPLDRETLRLVYWLSDVIVSLWSPDGLSQTLLESMACGRLPLVADIPGNREWIEDGRNGLLVDPADPLAISAGLERAITDKELAARARDENRRITVARADRKPNMDRLIDALVAMGGHDSLG